MADATIVAIANQKGGVGKSTTAINLGAGLAIQGERILLVDLDPQGNTSSGLGIDRSSIEYSTYDILINDVAIDEAIEPTSVRDLYVVPATIGLAGAEIELVSLFSREMRLGQALKPVVGGVRLRPYRLSPVFGLVNHQRPLGSRRSC